jgi:hypothetical protein
VITVAKLGSVTANGMKETSYSKYINLMWGSVIVSGTGVCFYPYYIAVLLFIGSIMPVGLCLFQSVCNLLGYVRHFIVVEQFENESRPIIWAILGYQ